MQQITRRRCRGAAAAVAALSLLPAATAFAQGASAGSAPPPVPDAQVTPEIAAEAQSARIPAERPQAQIVVIGMPDGQWAVASSYPKQVSQEEALGRLRKLIEVSGWKPNGDVKISDSAAPGESGGTKLSSASFTTANPVVDVANGRLPLEPFVRAFSDLSRINVTVFPPPGFTFNGLGDYSDKNVEVGLAPGQGTFTYVVNIKNHTPQSLSLPRQPSGTSGGATGQPAAMAAVVFLALAAAAGTFVAARAITAKRQ